MSLSLSDVEDAAPLVKLEARTRDGTRGADLRVSPDGAFPRGGPSAFPLGVAAVFGAPRLCDGGGC